jgi:hypothetical protein
MDHQHLEAEMGYPEGRFPIGIWLNILGEIVHQDDMEFQAKLHSMSDFPPRLVEDLMKLVRKLIASTTKRPPIIEDFEDGFLAPVQFIQEQNVRVIQLVIQNQAAQSKEYMRTLTESYTSKDQTDQLTRTKPIEVRTYIARIVSQKSAEAIEKEIVCTPTIVQCDTDLEVAPRLPGAAGSACRLSAGRISHGRRLRQPRPWSDRDRARDWPVATAQSQSRPRKWQTRP